MENKSYNDRRQQCAINNCKTLHSTPTLGGPRGNIVISFGIKTRIVCLPDNKKSFTICWTVLIEYWRAEDRQTERRTNILPQHSLRQATRRAVKITAIPLYNNQVWALRYLFNQFIKNSQFYRRAMLGINAAYAVSVRLFVTFLYYIETNEYIFNFFTTGYPHILVFPHQTLWQYSHGNLPNGGVECRWGRQKSRFSANTWLHRMLWTVWLPSAIHTATSDRGKLMTLVAGKRRCLFLSRVSILTRDIDIANLFVCLSVRLSVRYVSVPDENGLTYRHSFFHRTVAQSF